MLLNKNIIHNYIESYLDDYYSYGDYNEVEAVKLREVFETYKTVINESPKDKVSIKLLKETMNKFCLGVNRKLAKDFILYVESDLLDKKLP